jgi:hypothetical protein
MRLKCVGSPASRDLRSAARFFARAGTLTGLAVLSGCDAEVTSVGGALPLATGGGGAGIYIEAESGQLSGGFTIVADPTASEGRCIEPPEGASLDQPGLAHAIYDFAVTTAGSYRIWGRMHAPDYTRNTFWIQVDTGEWHNWRITTGEVWFWDAIHEGADYYRPLQFDLTAGAHTLVVANSIGGDQLDRFYITSGAETPPGNDTTCHPPHTVKLDGGCARSCGSQGGNECRSAFCTGHTLLQAYDCQVCCIVPRDGG